MGIPVSNLRDTLWDAHMNSNDTEDEYTQNVKEAFIGKYLYLPWKNFFTKTDTKRMITRAGSTPVGKALDRTHGLSAKIVGYDSNEEYNQATIQVMFKDGGPFSYFLEPPKPENQRRGNENMFLTHPAVYILTGNPCMGLDPEVFF